MQTAEITVQYLNQPKPGKKMWSIKSTEGTYYNVFPSDSGRFQQGETYHIQFETNESGFHTVKFPKSQAPQAKPAAPQRTAAPNGHTKSVEMFVMGTIGRCLQGAGTFPDGATLEGWIRDARRAWANGFSDDADDQEVPF